MSREVIEDYSGGQPRSVTVTITTDALGKMTIEIIDLPSDQVPTLLHQATQVIKQMKNASLKGD